MDQILAIVAWVAANGPVFATATVGALVGLIGLFTLIPGEQPEKALQGVVDFVAKFSKK